MIGWSCVESASPPSPHPAKPNTPAQHLETTPGKAQVHVQEQQDRIRHVNTEVATRAQLSEHTTNATHQLGLDARCSSDLIEVATSTFVQSMS